MTDVLVVDDAADIRLLVRAVLTPAGCRVSEAASAAEALAELDRSRPDIVLLDVQMPDADGWSVLEAIRSSERTASLPVMLCTVKGHPADLRRGWELGCDGYLNKPFAIRDLVDELMRVVQRTDDERAATRRQALVNLADLERVDR